MPTVLTFPAEVAILIQERNNGLYILLFRSSAKVFN